MNRKVWIFENLTYKLFHQNWFQIGLALEIRKMEALARFLFDHSSGYLKCNKKIANFVTGSWPEVVSGYFPGISPTNYLRSFPIISKRVSKVGILDGASWLSCFLIWNESIFNPAWRVAFKNVSFVASQMRKSISPFTWSNWGQTWITPG